MTTTPITTTIIAPGATTSGEDGEQLPAELLDQARIYAEASKAPSTLRAYSSAWATFTSWCEKHQAWPRPANPKTVAAFVAAMASTRKVSTLEKYLAAVGEAHRLSGHPAPTDTPEVRAVMKGIRRTHGIRQIGKRPLLVSHLRRIVHGLPDSPIGDRDRALLLVGFAGALRRAELVGLDVADLDFVEDGVIATIRYSKTDQQGEGREVGIPFGSNPATCPVRSLRRWLDQTHAEDGPVFHAVDRHRRISSKRLSDRAVALAVKRAVETIGLDPDEYSGHSLRAGLATEAARAGAGEMVIMAQTGHRSTTTVRGYIRHGSLFINNAAAMVGL
jgi:integrase